MGSGQENVPGNQIDMNTRSQKSSSGRNMRERSDTRHRVHVLEQNFVKIMKDIADIKKSIQTIKTVTTDIKGRTIIVTNR